MRMMIYRTMIIGEFIQDHKNSFNTIPACQRMTTLLDSVTIENEILANILFQCNI